MNEARIIKKYPNRRLYDTAISSYITLEEVKRLVQEQVALQVIDARTKEDITHNTLLQIIVEQESKQASLLNCDILQKMIRFYEGASMNPNAMSTLITQTFEKATHFLAEQHTLFMQEFKQELSATESQRVADLAPELVAAQEVGLQNLQAQWSHALESAATAKEQGVMEAGSDHEREQSKKS